MAGICERRPNASTTASGNAAANPTVDRTSVSGSPPQNSLGTSARPSHPPRSSTIAPIGTAIQHTQQPGLPPGASGARPRRARRTTGTPAPAATARRTDSAPNRMKRKRSPMTAQHAPSPFAARQREEPASSAASRSRAPPPSSTNRNARYARACPEHGRGDHVGAPSKHRGAPKRADQPAAPAAIVRHRGPSGPRRTHRAVVEIHGQRNRQADREVAGHRHRDRLDGLAGLIERGVGDRDQIGVADRHGQRRVLGEIQKLAGRRRNDHPQRLRHDDQPQDPAARQSERRRRLGLAPVDREDAAPDDLADERRRVGRQADQQRGELRRDRQAAVEIEADERRVFDRDHRTADQRPRPPAGRPPRRPAAASSAGRGRSVRAGAASARGRQERGSRGRAARRRASDSRHARRGRGERGRGNRGRRPGAAFSASRGPGSACDREYQNSSCSSSGVLRMTSTYPADSVDTTQMFDRRATPINTPNAVASRMPSSGDPECVDEAHCQRAGVGIARRIRQGAG